MTFVDHKVGKENNKKPHIQISLGSTDQQILKDVEIFNMILSFSGILVEKTKGRMESLNDS